MVSCLPRQGLKGGSFAHVHLASDSRIPDHGPHDILSRFSRCLPARQGRNRGAEMHMSKKNSENTLQQSCHHPA